MKTLRKGVSILLGAALVVLAPGLRPYELFAQTLTNIPGLDMTARPGVSPIQVSPVGGQVSPVNLQFSALQLKGQLPSFSAPKPTVAPRVQASVLASPAVQAFAAPTDDAKPVKAVVAENPVGRQSADIAQTAKSVAAELEPVAKQGTSDAQSSWSIRRAFDALLGRRSIAASAVTAEGPKDAAPATSQLKPAVAAPAPAPAPVPAPPVNDSGFTPEEVQRGVWGMTANRLFSMISTSLSSIAYPLMVIGAVGKVDFLTLSAIGGVASIGLSLLAGKVGDMMPLKKYTIFNIGLRAGIYALQALFFKAGWLGFWPLMGLTILSTWQFATLFSNDFALQTEIVGKDAGKIRSTEALIRMTTIIVTVVSGLILSAAVIHALGFFWTFILTAAVQAISIPVMAWLLPSGGRMNSHKLPSWGEAKAAVKAALANAWARFKGLFAKGQASAGDALKSAAFKRGLIAAAGFAAAIALFFIPIPFAAFLYHSPVPLVVVAAAMLWRSATFQTLIRPNKLLAASLLFVMIGAFIEVPLRNSILGVLASEVSKDAGAAASYLGTLIAAFYMGQMPSGTGILDPKLEVGPGRFKVNFRNMMKWVGAAMVAAWTYFVLIPKGAVASALVKLAPGLLAAVPPAALTAVIAAAVMGLAVAGYVALHDYSPKLSDSAWMKLEAGALLFMSLPLFFWGQPWALYLALAAFGFVLNGSQRMVSATFSTQAKKLAPDQFQFVSGMRGAFFNISSSIAYAVYSVAAIVPHLWQSPKAFPFTWYVIAAVYAVFGVMFWKGSTVFAKPKAPAEKPASK